MQKRFTNNRFTVTEAMALEKLIENADLAKFHHWTDETGQRLSNPENPFWTVLLTKIDNLIDTDNY